MYRVTYRIVARRPREGEHGPVVGGDEEHRGILTTEAGSKSSCRNLARWRAGQVFDGWMVRVYEDWVEEVPA